MPERVNYAVDPIAAKFHNDRTSWLKIITGSVGTGKTWACIMDLVFHACLVVPPSQRQYTGERKARYAIIRRTAPRLETTVQVTIEKIFKKTAKIHGQYPTTPNSQRQTHSTQAKPSTSNSS
jgi:hypothetical protein